MGAVTSSEWASGRHAVDCAGADRRAVHVAYPARTLPALKEERKLLRAVFLLTRTASR